MIQPEDVAATLEELKPYFATIVEAQLKDYGESANAGCWVSFRVPMPEDLEPFRGQDRSGRNARTGKRYTLMLIEINDQEEHVQQPGDPKPRKLSSIAGALCNDPAFRAWLEHTYGEPVPDAEGAAQVVREVCGVESRAHLDTVEAAASLFRELISDFDAAKRDVPQS